MSSLAVAALALAAVLSPTTVSEVRAQQETCLQTVERVSNVCAGVLTSSDPFELLNCCEGAKVANERKCFCEADVALTLGSSYDATLDVLESGCSIPISVYGSVDCFAHNNAAAAAAAPPQRQRANVAVTKPVSFWNLDDDANSNVASDSMNNINGLYSAEVTLGLEGPGPDQTSAYFSGLNSYVLIPYTPLVNTANFTISTTLMPSPRQGEETRASTESIVENFADTSMQTVVIGGYGLERQWVGPNARGLYEPKWAFAVGTPVGPIVVTSRSDASNGVWSQIAGVYDAATRTASLYVNGDLEASRSLGQQIMLGNPQNDMLIGNGNRLTATGDTSVPYVGRISQVAFFDVPLDEAEVASLYQSSFPSAAPKKGLPLWAIILATCLSVLVVVAIAAALFVWKFKGWRQRGAPKMVQNETNASAGKGLPSLHEENDLSEQLTPKGNRTPSADVHPRFKKIGSRISVTWN